jgi:tetratricopeptide (TPR) repeat protein
MKLQCLLVAAVVAISQHATAETFELCGGFGEPSWDYTNPVNRQPTAYAPQGRIRLVESQYFNSNVEQLIRGTTASNPLGDIKHTLRQLPNHHRALWALSRASRSTRWSSGTNPAEVRCFFQRAAHFNKNDPMVMFIHAMHLHQEREFAEAEQKYLQAGKLGLDTSEYHYNFGLLLFDKEDYAQAREHALKAYTLGYPLPALKRKLVDAGHWTE